MKRLPPNTNDIYDRLRTGKFISINALADEHKRLAHGLENENYEALKEYFAQIDLSLEKGDGYYYFTKDEPNQQLEEKLEKAFRWIDILDFLKAYNVSFGPGFRFSPAQITQQCGVDATLKNKLESLGKQYRSLEKHAEVVQKLINDLENATFIELEDSVEETYKVLDAFRYLEELVLLINIPDDVLHEISE